MVIDKNYFLTRLANGENIDDIGMEIADLMNAAMADHEAKVAAEKAAAEEARKEANLLNTKRELALDLVEIIQNYGAIVAPEACVDLLTDITDEDLDAMIQTLDEMFKMMAAMVELKDALTPVLEAQPKSKVTPVPKKSKSDDEVLANFIKSLL
jgi:hypothetical protein